MPIHLPPHSVSRRRFLASFLAISGATSVIQRRASGGQTSRPKADLYSGTDSWALLSDTHIAGDPSLNARGINMADHLRQAVHEVLKDHAERPWTGLLINGDCAYLDGQTEDYQVLGSLLQPVTGCGIPIHLTLGNHDERNRIQEGILGGWNPGNSGMRSRAPMEDKIASCIRGMHCDWYLLDSLEFTNKTSGRLGEAQLAWLKSSLESNPERPALVMVHHNPDFGTDGRLSGLRDTKAFWELLERQRQVKALFFGHTHKASVSEIEGLHLINLPACAYRFAAEQPTGWTAATVSATGCVLRLYDTEQSHPLHGVDLHLRWRS